MQSVEGRAGGILNAWRCRGCHPTCINFCSRQSVACRVLVAFALADSKGMAGTRQGGGGEMWGEDERLAFCRAAAPFSSAVNMFQIVQIEPSNTKTRVWPAQPCSWRTCRMCFEAYICTTDETVEYC